MMDEDKKKMDEEKEFTSLDVVVKDVRWNLIAWVNVKSM